MEKKIIIIDDGEKFTFNSSANMNLTDFLGMLELTKALFLEQRLKPQQNSIIPAPPGLRID